MNLDSLKSKLLSIPGIISVSVVEEDEDGPTLLLDIRKYSVDLGLKVARTIGETVADAVERGEDIGIDWDYRIVN